MIITSTCTSVVMHIRAFYVPLCCPIWPPKPLEFTLLYLDLFSGLSGKTQLLFALVFTTRYLDFFLYYVSLYNSLMKCGFVILSYLTCYFMYMKFKSTYNKADDSFQVLYLLIPAAILALLINHRFTPVEVS